MSAATGILTAWPTLPSVSPSRKIMSMSLSTACARSCPARHTALLVPLRRGRRPRRPALPRSLFPSVGATLAVAHGRGRAPPLRTTRNAPSRADRVVRPCKIMPCRAGPMCPAVPPYPLQKARHCHSQCAHWLWQFVLLKGSPTTRCPTRKIPSGSRGFRRGFLCPISIFS